MWHCPHCADSLENAESVCARCGALAVGTNPFVDRDQPVNPLPSALEPSELVIPEKILIEELIAQSEAKLDSYAPYQTPRAINVDCEDSIEAQLERKSRMAKAAEEASQFSLRMSLREVFGLMTFLSLVFAFLLNFGDFGVGIVSMILIVNFLGILLGLVITYGFGLPNDGSLPNDSEA